MLPARRPTNTGSLVRPLASRVANTGPTRVRTCCTRPSQQGVCLTRATSRWCFRSRASGETPCPSSTVRLFPPNVPTSRLPTLRAVDRGATAAEEAAPAPAQGPPEEPAARLSDRARTRPQRRPRAVEWATSSCVVAITSSTNAGFFRQSRFARTSKCQPPAPNAVSALDGPTRVSH